MICFVYHEEIKKLIFLVMICLLSFDSVLPEDEWFYEICQEVIEWLSGKLKAINGARDLNSPTASISAQSMSSVGSHGSS